MDGGADRLDLGWAQQVRKQTDGDINFTNGGVEGWEGTIVLVAHGHMGSEQALI